MHVLFSVSVGQFIYTCIWAPSSEFVSLSIPSWQILTAHVQPFRGARDLAFCLKVPLDSLLVWASSEGSGETARMRRLAWAFAACIGSKYQIRLTQPIQYTDSKKKQYILFYSDFLVKRFVGCVGVLRLFDTFLVIIEAVSYPSHTVHRQAS